MKILRISLLLLVIAGLLGVQGAQAMSSPHYRLDWLVPLTGAGGGETASTNYRANYTIGQTAVGQADSPGYQITLGFWSFKLNAQAHERPWHVHLPVLMR